MTQLAATKCELERAAKEKEEEKRIAKEKAEEEEVIDDEHDQLLNELKQIK